MRIEGVEDEERTALEKVTSKEDDQGDEQEVEEEEELKRRKTRRKHEMTHPPFRSWCRRIASVPHEERKDDCRRTTVKERNAPEIHVDGRKHAGALGRELDR